ncbi:MAG: C10 family peptidase [Bacteroidota bacterium]
MKKLLLILSSGFVSSTLLLSQNIDYPSADLIVTGKLKADNKLNYKVTDFIPVIGDDALCYAYIYSLTPTGYVVVTAIDDLPPVIAYSYNTEIDSESKLYNILKKDIKLRIDNLDRIPAEITDERNHLKNLLISGSYSNDRYDQWPPAGSTSTGGWLETNWTQNAPYNNMCPMDPVTVVRSIAGCPSVAMAMIVNFHETLNGVFFDDNDDYYHNYAGRQYWIDDDSFTIKFPPFPELNLYLDTLEQHLQAGYSLTNNDKASLVFACGVAATQVYTSSGSGTFGVDQAFEAYQKFNFPYIELLFESDTDLYSRIISNIIDTLPVHLAIVNQTWTSGHNVVIDGYNTDEYFHLNFGWGGNSNGWYLLPDEIPYGLTVVEGAIVDIMTDSQVSTNEMHKSVIEIFPNPSSNYIHIRNIFADISSYQIFSSKGVLIDQNPFVNNKINISSLPAGIYLIRILNKNEIFQCTFIKN